MHHTRPQISLRTAARAAPQPLPVPTPRLNESPGRPATRTPVMGLRLEAAAALPRGGCRLAASHAPQTSCRGADPVLAARNLELAVLDHPPQEALQLLRRQVGVRGYARGGKYASRVCVWVCSGLQGLGLGLGLGLG